MLIPGMIYYLIYKFYPMYFTPAGLQQRGKLLFIRLIHQSMGQYIPQVLICLFRVNGKKLGIVSIAAICPKQLLKLFFAFCSVDGIYHAGGQKLYGVIPQLGDLIGEMCIRDSKDTGKKKKRREVRRRNAFPPSANGVPIPVMKVWKVG